MLMPIGVPMICPDSLILELSNLGKSGTGGFGSRLDLLRIIFGTVQYWTEIISHSAYDT